MKSFELVSKTIKGINNTGITPLYAWVFDNVVDKIIGEFGSMHEFEDHYKLDMAHIFGGPSPYDGTILAKARADGTELTPDILLQLPMNDASRREDYLGVTETLKHQSGSRERFCYMQTPGIFECLNDVFGIEAHLCYLAMYPDELAEVYKRQAEWNVEFANNMIDLGVDMIHISDDWGGQNSLMFSPQTWRELIFPNHKIMTDAVKARDRFVSLHSDGNINSVLDGIVELGFDLIHPYQEMAGMSYDTYLQSYRNSFALLGGICIQSTLGFGDYDKLTSEINRVFSLLKGRRWVCCTTHIVQPHCSIEELVYAYDLAMKLCGK